ncbi:ethanolamine ammonia-lyase subunit EutC [Marinomonas mediterranea]|uniref:ethanolamine ammonia-lyase subunit EutC n=1 Tax=Marinomonas mediterranea TaxID=119864 RepID=UPI00234A5062|nr:ethanolamine ammonia-lyase subunit EutC [Marinomonas mediterranea]WCN07782.1 ethanolamine ammonia-lyase subunit EutC [Marinomonas mediterranea]
MNTMKKEQKEEVKHEMNNTANRSTDFPSHPTEEAVVENPWERLRSFTDARIGLGRAGVSVPTKHLMNFQLAHAKAQDAVRTPLNTDELIQHLKTQDWNPSDTVHKLHSHAKDRPEYLQRPDYGRMLDADSVDTLTHYRQESNEGYDLAFAIVDGLSAFAIEENITPFLSTLIPQLTSTKQQSTPWKIAPLCVVEQGRVAIGDHIGELLNAKCVVVLVGERPGLSSPDSMGLYLTWAPKTGLTDAYRNCISNIRMAGMSYADASYKAMYLLTEARVMKLSGVNLKDRTGDEVLEHDSKDNNFLIS